MEKPTLFITRPLPELVIAAATKICEVTIASDNIGLNQAEGKKKLDQFDAILPTLGDDFGSQTILSSAGRRCRLLANFGVGYNHIDVDAATSCGLTVTNTPGAVTEATADIAITLMLMVARRAGEGERLVRAGKWAGWNPTQMLGVHISGKTLGVIGMGRIGLAVARRAHFGFGMDVVYYNRSKITDTGVPSARQLGSIAEVMAQSDVISINVPGGGGNRHLISAEMLAHARPSSFVINTARGDVIDQVALIEALKSKALAGAGLDVYEDEPQVPAALIALENVVLLPHLGTNALDVRTEMGLMAVENIRAFFSGETPPNKV